MIDFSKVKVSKPDRLRFGPAGIPLSTNPRNIMNAVAEVQKLGLGAMELEFVQSVFLNEKSAPEVNELRQKHDIMLTAHGSYFINLNAKEKEKVGASRSRIIQAANMCRLAGGYSMTFHSAFYLGMPESEVYNNVKTQMKRILEELRSNGNNIWVRPETTGKPKQWAGLTEILKLSQEIEGVMPCVDFAHMHARTGGKNNSVPEFKSMLDEIEKALGREGLDNMHIHMSGIAYSDKGEQHHLLLDESDFKWRDLIRTWKEYRLKGVVACESPNLEGDALLMKKEWERK